ncbi:MAG: HesA/MoeB/ThiF family protein [Brevinematia bacterium]
MNLSDEELIRYGRHIILKGIGIEGQEKIKNSKVLVVGAGGLGSASIYYLAAIGVGIIGIVENDVVDISNLQRQILHDTEHIGIHKGEVAKKKIKALNPNVEVVLYKTLLDTTNVIDIIKDYEIVIDGSDNFQTKFLLNDVCYFLKKPLIHGAVLGFEGQLSVFVPSDNTPCYRCIYEEIPEEGLACKDLGVLGTVPGTIGILQATETIKLITGIGKPLIGEILVYNSLLSEFKKFKIKKNPSCPLCGTNPKIIKIDQENYKSICLDG